MTQQAEVSPIGYFRSLLESGALPHTLKGIPDQDFSLIYMANGSRREFSSSPAEEFSAMVRVEIGCIAKNLTSLLIAMGVSEGLLRFDDEVGGYFSYFPAGNSPLKVFHLLNHTHGLDGSALQRIPQNGEGYINSDVVWRAVMSAPRLHAPGELFHYHGHAGMWLAAAILERVHERKFSELLRDQILRPLGIACDADMQTICPAAGGMELCAEELIRLCSLHLGHYGIRLTSAIGDMSVRFRFPLPQWPPIADFAGLGWFGFRGNSFGMYGQRLGTSALILISPDEQAALALTARSEGAISMARKMLLGKLVSDGQAGPPRLLSRQDRQALPIAAIVGRYASAEFALEITCTPRGDLRAEMSRRNTTEAADAHVVTQLLLPAADNVFFPVRPERTILPFVKLVGDLGGAFANALVGKRVLRRVGADDPLRHGEGTYTQLLPDRG